MASKRDGTTFVGVIEQPMEVALDDLQEFVALGAVCRKCEREGWIDRHEVRRTWGNAILGSLQARLRCLGCGNKDGNRWIEGRLPR
jgi:hypothetical protein